MTLERIWLIALTNAIAAFALRSDFGVLSIAGCIGYAASIACMAVCLWRWIKSIT